MRLVRAIRSNWPSTRILIRAHSHYCSPQIIDWCRANDVDFILGVVRIPVMPDGYSNLKPDRYSDFMPDTIPI
ncbi:transposase [Mesorhizobium sp. M1088]|uniref:transposase n=1 Tax=Mesorhizobium sp. M1088 TaxID=2957056 RepID=UPI00333DEB17